MSETATTLTPIRTAAPPYVAYRTLMNFLDKFRQGVPGRIERSHMGTMSGAAQGQITAALRYLKLISDAGIPTELMKRFCVSEGKDKQELLRAMLHAAYPYIFETSIFDFGTATPSMVREQIETHTTATGETINRCLAFLKDAAKDAGISVSRFLSQKTRTARKKANGKRKADPQPSSASIEAVISPVVLPGNTSIPAQSSLLLWGLFQRLPKPGTAWSKVEREQWTQTLNHVLAMEYPEN